MGPYENMFDIATKICNVDKMRGIETDPLEFVKCIDRVMENMDNPVTGFWKPEFKKGGLMHSVFTKKILELPVKTINGYGEENTIVKTRVMCEIVKIPLEDICDLKSILKLAFYNAYAKFYNRTSDFPNGIYRAFTKMKMHLLHNYLVSMEGYREVSPSKEYVDDIISQILLIRK